MHDPYQSNLQLELNGEHSRVCHKSFGTQSITELEPFTNLLASAETVARR